MIYKLLIIDDDNLICLALKKSLQKLGYDADFCQKPMELLDKVKSYKPDIILLDVYLGEVNGLEVLEQLQKSFPHISVIMITGYADIRIAVNAIKVGAYDFLIKPLESEKLNIVIKRCIDTLKLKSEVSRLETIINQDYIPRDFFGQSRSILITLNSIDKIIQSDRTTVLLDGESGTGKEVFAKYIHQNSPRSKQPFITVNCGSIPKDLAESELFGHEKGAFTGASTKTKLGKFELADGGTILLDEIGELSLEMQVKLLRVLQEKKFYRLGGEKEISVDVRVLAATNKNLENEINRGAFREDLYFRLNVAKITIPPLRERKEDIPILAYRFLNEFGLAFNKDVRGFSADTLEILVDYHWKGNVRELRNAIERAVLMNEDKEIKPKHISFLKLENKLEQLESGGEFLLKIPEDGIDYNSVIKELIQKTLYLTNGNQVRAAAILKLTRAKLRYKMKELGITVSKIIE